MVGHCQHTTEAMKLLPAFLGALFITILSGCAYVQYTPYEGNDPSVPLSNGAFVNREYALPIYQGFPPRPYKVLGLIEASERAISYEGTYHAAVRVAKAKGADAVMILGKDSRYAGSQGGGTFSSNTFWNAQGQASMSPGSHTAYGSASGTGTTFGGGTTWSRAIWLEQGTFIAIQWISAPENQSKPKAGQ